MGGRLGVSIGPVYYQDVADSPDSLEAVAQRISAMSPIVLGQDMADNLGAQIGDRAKG